MSGPTIDYHRWAPGYGAMRALDGAVRGSGLEGSLQELIKVRASQINGCAYCIDMHTKDARAAGETEQRLYALSAWRETPFFSDRERAALALTEEVTRVADAHPSPGTLAAAREQFSPDELVAVLYAIVCINAWNRLGITSGHPEPGSYQQARAATAG
jgi:AhpD family alkylhydroperoxidase